MGSLKNHLQRTSVQRVVNLNSVENMCVGGGLGCFLVLMMYRSYQCNVSSMIGDVLVLQGNKIGDSLPSTNQSCLGTDESGSEIYAPPKTSILQNQIAERIQMKHFLCGVLCGNELDQLGKRVMFSAQTIKGLGS